MIFKYPEEFIVPVRTFRLKNENDSREQQLKSKRKSMLQEKIVNDVMQIKAEYEKDKSMWRCFDKYYSESETGMLRSYYNKN